MTWITQVEERRNFGHRVGPEPPRIRAGMVWEVERGATPGDA